MSFTFPDAINVRKLLINLRRNERRTRIQLISMCIGEIGTDSVAINNAVHMDEVMHA